MSKKTVNFHVESQDYFGTLATVIALVCQGVEGDQINHVVLESIVKDLMYLQTNHLIIHKEDLAKA